MKNLTYRLHDSLACIYDDVRSEMGFGFSLQSLLTDTDIWETDVASCIEQAYEHLYRANSRIITDTEKTGQILLAELHIRALVENLSGELAEFPPQSVRSV